MKPLKTSAPEQPENYVDTLHGLIYEDMQFVDNLIHDSLQSDVVLINQVGHYIVNSGGKRLRPALLLLIARHFEIGRAHV